MSYNGQDKGTKYVAGHIPVDLFWEFKKVHVMRQEKISDALKVAIQLYIDIGDGREEDE